MDKVERQILWKKKYYTKKIVDFSKYLDKKDIEVLKKFGCEINKQLYTEYEFDIIDGKLLLYYCENGEKPDEKYKLENIGVTQKEYNAILKKFEQISKDYEF